VLRFLLWRLLGVLAALVGVALIAWLLTGGPGRALRDQRPGEPSGLELTSLPRLIARAAAGLTAAIPHWAGEAVLAILLAALSVLLVLAATRAESRRRRERVRLRIDVYRADQAEAPELARMFTALHGRLQSRWWRRLLRGQPSLALEVHRDPANPAAGAWMALVCPRGHERTAETALQVAYPNTRLLEIGRQPDPPATVLRLKKRNSFLERTATASSLERAPEPPMNRLLSTLAASGQSRGSGGRDSGSRTARRCWTPSCAAGSRSSTARCSSPTSESWPTPGQAASRLRRCSGFSAARTSCSSAAPPCVTARSACMTGASAAVKATRSQEFAAACSPPMSWHCCGSSPPATTRRCRSPVAACPWHPPLPPSCDPPAGTARCGTHSDLRRDRCAVIVLDPKGDAADAAITAVPDGRVCTVLDFAHPTCGFNPLAVEAPADVIADYVVAALKNLFTDAKVILGR
jgi:hypothetical protein